MLTQLKKSIVQRQKNFHLNKAILIESQKELTLKIEKDNFCVNLLPAFVTIFSFVYFIFSFDF